MQVHGDVTHNRIEPTGLRIGVQEMTRFGMKEPEMKSIASFMRQALIERENPVKLARQVIEFRNGFQTLYCSFDKASRPV